MRITKALAQQIASKVVAPKNGELKNLQKKLNSKVYDLVIKYMPENIKKGFKSNPSYFKTRQSTYFNSDKANCTTLFHTDINFPSTGGDWNAGYIKISDEELIGLEKEHLNIEEFKTIIDNNETEVETALLQLGTVKRVQTELPDLQQYLPTGISSALVPNMDKVREIIKQS